MARSSLCHIRKVAFTLRTRAHQLDCAFDSPTTNYLQVQALPHTTSPRTPSLANLTLGKNLEKL